MKNRKKSALCLALCLSLLLPFPVRAQDTNTAELAASFQKLCDGTLSPGESVSDWAVIALNLCGITGENRAYQKGLEQYVTDTCRAKGTLDRVKATEYHRIALAAMAVGMDPRCVGRDRIDLVADGVWNFRPGLEKQGLNGLLYALILLDAGDFELPADCGMTRESLVDRVLARQEEDGSFGLAEGSSDADITAMALQALGPYREREDVKAAGERAFAWLSSLLTERGTFLAGGNESAETMAQCILALCAFGIDPAGAESFSREGRSLLENLEWFRRDGGYVHAIADEKINPMATEQVLLALCAVEKLQSGEKLYHFAAGGESSRGTVRWIIPGIAAAGIGGAFAAGRKRRKKA